MALGADAQIPGSPFGYHTTIAYKSTVESDSANRIIRGIVPPGAYNTDFEWWLTGPGRDMVADTKAGTLPASWGAHEPAFLSSANIRFMPKPGSTFVFEVAFKDDQDSSENRLDENYPERIVLKSTVDNYGRQTLTTKMRDPAFQGVVSVPLSQLFVHNSLTGSLDDNPEFLDEAYLFATIAYKKGVDDGAMKEYPGFFLSFVPPGAPRDYRDYYKLPQPGDNPDDQDAFPGYTRDLVEQVSNLGVLTRASPPALRSNAGYLLVAKLSGFRKCFTLNTARSRLTGFDLTKLNITWIADGAHRGAVDWTKKFLHNGHLTQVTDTQLSVAIDTPVFFAGKFLHGTYTWNFADASVTPVIPQDMRLTTGNAGVVQLMALRVAETAQDFQPESAGLWTLVGDSQRKSVNPLLPVRAKVVQPVWVTVPYTADQAGLPLLDLLKVLEYPAEEPVYVLYAFKRPRDVNGVATVMASYGLNITQNGLALEVPHIPDWRVIPELTVHQRMRLPVVP